MSDPALGLTMLGLIVLAIMMGFPTAFTLMGLGILFGFIAFYNPAAHWLDNRVFDLMVQRTYGGMLNDTLLSIPLFVLMGYVIERAALVDKMFFAVQLAFRRLPASLAVTTLLVCAFWGIASGIVGAVVVLMGVIAMRPMLSAGYDVRLASGVLCAGGCLGIMIPPSIMLIVYGAQAGISVVKLYAAALLPGFLLAAMYIVYVIVLAIIKPRLAPPLPKEQGNVTLVQMLLMLSKSFIPLALLILCVLGAIMFGLATPTEAAAVGAFGAILLAAGYRALTWQGLREAVFLTARTSAMVCWLFVGSSTFASIFAYLGGEGIIKEFVLGLDMNSVMFLIAAQIIIFLLGWPLEWTEIIIIFVPIFLPLLAHFNIDPLLFGVLVALNLQTAFLSPPMAMSAYYLKGVAPKTVLLTQIFRGCMPFLYIVIVCMLIVYVFPEIALWLPRAIYG